MYQSPGSESLQSSLFTSLLIDFSDISFVVPIANSCRLTLLAPSELLPWWGGQGNSNKSSGSMRYWKPLISSRLCGLTAKLLTE